jgi:hypothetical protein
MVSASISLAYPFNAFMFATQHVVLGLEKMLRGETAINQNCMQLVGFCRSEGGCVAIFQWPMCFCFSSLAGVWNIPLFLGFSFEVGVSVLPDLVDLSTFKVLVILLHGGTQGIYRQCQFE